MRRDGSGETSHGNERIKSKLAAPPTTGIELSSRQNAVIFGVSRDSIASHEKFKAKQMFPFDLLSDPDEKLCRKFDVIKEKTLYGRKFLGIERSTFLIDEAGKLREEWRKVKVKGHAAAVLDAVKNC